MLKNREKTRKSREKAALERSMHLVNEVPKDTVTKIKVEDDFKEQR